MNKKETATRLDALRNELKTQNLDGFLVPMADEYQNEYVPECAQRLRWLTGFTGSSGFAIVLQDTAAFFTDGRYSVQMKQQVPDDVFKLYSISPNQGDIQTLQPHEWIKEEKNIGYDPWLHTDSSIARFKNSGAILTPCTTNPIDAVWTDRPPAPNSPVVPHDLKYAGKPSVEKRTALGDTLERENCDATVLALQDSIAWLLNIRGSDTPCTPFALSYAIVHIDGTVDWFIDEKRFENLQLDNGIRVHAPDQFEKTLQSLKNKTVLIDPDETPVKIKQVLESAGAEMKNGDDPCQLPKACKNEAEQNGMRAAHVRDGAALTRFLYRLSKGDITSEMQAFQSLTEERRKEKFFKDVSFEPITGAGANGAIVHYRVTEDTNAEIKPDMLFLCDSGGQYLDGTTDVTRTVAIGTPTREQQENFTRVLKGHIQLARAQFPFGTNGAHLDTLARGPLWDEGLDFSHGTGHGVGSYLSVHEGPQNISGRSTVPLKSGMVVSNEPGYYKEGAYGIRIENLVLVCESTHHPGFLYFETLTLAPIDPTLIISEMLTEAEKIWLNSYHARVYETLSPRLDNDVATWLKNATAAI